MAWIIGLSKMNAPGMASKLDEAQALETGNSLAAFPGNKLNEVNESSLPI